MRLPLLAAAVALGSLAAAFATDGRNTDDRGVLAAIARAPQKARDQKNPYEGRPEAAAAGKKLFRQHCTECHGEDAAGRGHAANLRGPSVQKATPGELAWLLRNGNLPKGMPPWAGIPEQRRWQIVSYLKSLGTAPGARK